MAFQTTKIKNPLSMRLAGNLFGGRQAYLFEHRVLTGSVIRKVAWVKGSVDLAELARLRRIEGLTIGELAAHFLVGMGTIKERLRRLHSS